MTLPRSWTAEQLIALDNLWLAGEKASKISQAIGKSKNAVIGMAHRRELPKRPSPIRRGPPANKLPIPSRRPQRAYNLPQKPDSELRELLALSAKGKPKARHAPGNCCQWPMWDDGEARAREAREFCGKQTTPGSVYCEFHHQQAYRPAPPRTAPTPTYNIRGRAAA